MKKADMLEMLKLHLKQQVFHKQKYSNISGLVEQLSSAKKHY